MGADAEVKVIGLYSPERTYLVPAHDEATATRLAKDEYHKEFTGIQGTVKSMEVTLPSFNEAVVRKTGDAVDARVIRAADAQG